MYKVYCRTYGDRWQGSTVQQRVLDLLMLATNYVTANEILDYVYGEYDYEPYAKTVQKYIHDIKLMYPELIIKNNYQTGYKIVNKPKVVLCR